jgi:FkbM family methyltransferase
MLIEFSKCNSLIETIFGTRIKKVCHVGAHHGEEASIYFENGVQSVMWFEANESLLPELRAHVVQYPMEQFILPHPLLDEDRLVQLHVTNNSQATSVFALDRVSEFYPQIVVDEVRPVQGYRLDTLMGRVPPYLPWVDPDFLNFDTQGAELAILKGMGTYLAQPSIKGIYLEVNWDTLYKDAPLIGEIDAFLLTFGFCRVITHWTHAIWGDAFYLKTLKVNGDT